MTQAVVLSVLMLSVDVLSVARLYVVMLRFYLSDERCKV
jgi:hypothetical protein